MTSLRSMTRACVRLLVRDFGHGVDILGSRLAAQIDATIADDAIEPGREFRAAVLPLTAMRPDLEHGVLHHVLGVRRIADDAQGDRIGPVDVPYNQGAKRGFIARRQAIEQILVFVEDDSVAARCPARSRPTRAMALLTSAAGAAAFSASSSAGALTSSA